jgi:hypothetical protein
MQICSNLEKQVSYLDRCKLQAVDRLSVPSTHEIYCPAALGLQGSGAVTTREVTRSPKCAHSATTVAPVITV